MFEGHPETKGRCVGTSNSIVLALLPTPIWGVVLAEHMHIYLDELNTWASKN
jgi:hypothetical protein